VPDGGLHIFVLSVLLFMLAAYMAQVLMLEYLSGILDIHDSKLLMGLSETCGCAFAMLGGYLGDVLEVYGAAAPFALQSAVALLTVVMVGASLGHRHVTRCQALAPECDGQRASTEPRWSGISMRLPSCARQSVVGVQAIATGNTEGTFMGSERLYRKVLASNASPAQSLTRSLLSDQSPLSETFGGSSPLSSSSSISGDVDHSARPSSDADIAGSA